MTTAMRLSLYALRVRRLDLESRLCGWPAVDPRVRAEFEELARLEKLLVEEIHEAAFRELA